MAPRASARSVAANVRLREQISKLRSLGGHWGYLVIGAPAEPPPDEQFLLRVLIQQTGAALANATLHGRERTNAVALESVNKQLVSVNDQLTATVSYLERTTRIHEVLTQVAASGEGEEGIARAV